MAQRVIPLGIDAAKQRSRSVELAADSLTSFRAAGEALFTADERAELLSVTLPEMLRRDLAYKGHLSDSVNMSSRLLAWIELG